MSRVERHAAEEKAAPKKKRKGRVTPFGKFLNIIGTLIMLLAILLSLALAVPKFTGIQSYVVISGSMEPTIPVGSMVYAKPVTPASVKEGDIIVFYSTDPDVSGSNALPVTHRVVKNNKTDSEIITKGDANAQEDLFPVSYVNVKGIVLQHVPYLGYVASPLASPMGKLALILIILAGYLLTEVGSRIRRNI